MAANGLDKTTLESALNAEVKGLLKAEIVRRCVSHQMLADLLSSSGIKTTKASVDNKLSRGSFSAEFFLQCLRVIGCKEIRIVPEVIGGTYEKGRHSEVHQSS